MDKTGTRPRSGNRTLSGARVNKQDEFYTRLEDIANELKHYREQFKGKVVLCNCDDPFESNFFKYFASNFNVFGLKKLICTSYSPSPIAQRELPFTVMEGLKGVAEKAKLPRGKACVVEIDEVPDVTKDGTTNLDDVELLLRNIARYSRPLKGDGVSRPPGDFRSKECVEILKQADIVVTNPPFSLFREYVALLVQHDKKFLIIGNTNALTYKEIFQLIKEDRFRTGYTNFNVGMFFLVPDDWNQFHHIDQRTGKKIARVSTSCWYTNMDVAKHHEFIPLYKRYSPEEYPTYVNYDAIEVSKIAHIPVDYDGVMGVPITFLDKYNPDQFEIVGGNTDGYLAAAIGIKPLGPEFVGNVGRTKLGLASTKRAVYKRILIRHKCKG